MLNPNQFRISLWKSAPYVHLTVMKRMYRLLRNTSQPEIYRVHKSRILQECLHLCIVQYIYKDINNHQTDISCNVHMLKCIWSMPWSHVQI